MNESAPPRLSSSEAVELVAVEQAVDRLVAAFARHDVLSYFDCFAPDASFVFHTVPARLESSAAYRSQWERWEAEGFRVLECICSQRRVERFGDTAVVSHVVRTELMLGGTRQVLHERETIVLVRDARGHWQAVHEHLSACPTP